MRVRVVGDGVLAQTTRVCCAPYFGGDVQVGEADLVWACEDTPIGAGDRPDVDWVVTRLRSEVVGLTPRTPVVLSSQVPVGTTARLEREWPHIDWAYSPENIRVKTAVADFQRQARIIAGRRGTAHDDRLRTLFAPFTDTVLLTDPETAEMCKHALNAYLGLSIAFMNEIARVAAVVGADAQMISQALLTEARISPRAPLRPGPPFGEGHLARDIYVLTALAQEQGIAAPIISHIRESNEGGR